MILEAASCDVPFLLGKRVEGAVLREVDPIKLQKYGIRGRWVEQLKFALGRVFGVEYAQ